jgi:hypothetical protein
MQLTNLKTLDNEKITYLLSGVRVTSELDFPELSQLIVNDDDHSSQQVHIRLGDVPEVLADAEHRHGYQVNHNNVLLDIPDIARYLIRDGNEILVDPVPTADEKDVRLFLLGSAFGMLLHQRGILPMHASAIEVDNRCILFTGDSGSGKSTIAAFLHKNGYRILTDDVCAITFGHNNDPVAWPGFPRVKLWSDTLHALKQKTENLTPDGMRAGKYHLPLNDTFSKHPLPITHIYSLREHTASVSHIEPLSTQDAVSAIVNNIYRGGVLQSKKHKLQNFQQCMSLAQKTNVSQLSRRKDFEDMNEILHSLEKHWASQENNGVDKL